MSAGEKMISITVQEVSRIAKLAISKFIEITEEKMMQWSCWRRKHQYTASLYHQKRNAIKILSNFVENKDEIKDEIKSLLQL